MSPIVWAYEVPTVVDIQYRGWGVKGHGVQRHAGVYATNAVAIRAAFPKLEGREPICGGSRKVFEM
jgi:hypothetical protein